MATHSELVGAAGTVFEVIKVLVQNVENQGGSEDDVRRLLREPDLAIQIARKLVGPVWKRVETSVMLRVDWASDMPAFCTAMAESLTFAPGLFNPGWRPYGKAYFLDENPRHLGGYRLAHFNHAVMPSAVIHDYNVAGFRELCAFMTSCTRITRTKIVALGSLCKDKSSPEDVSYVSAYGDSIAWIRQATFRPDWFFLIRD